MLIAQDWLSEAGATFEERRGYNAKHDLQEMFMAYNCIVLVKQVPDTAHITGKAMKEDGTVQPRGVAGYLNPEDLNALEMAVQVSDHYGGQVTVLTMGPARVADMCA